ncbi:MAG: SPOR domain-containing protein, partial [Nitrospinota bacterium]
TSPPKPVKAAVAPKPVSDKPRRSSVGKRTAAVQTGRYAIQVGACRTPKCVRAFSSRLKELGLEPFTRKSGGGKLTLVLVGAYRTRGEARVEIERLKKRGFRGPYAVKR